MVARGRLYFLPTNVLPVRDTTVSPGKVNAILLSDWNIQVSLVLCHHMSSFLSILLTIFVPTNIF